MDKRSDTPRKKQKREEPNYAPQQSFLAYEDPLKNTLLFRMSNTNQMLFVKAHGDALAILMVESDETNGISVIDGESFEIEIIDDKIQILKEIDDEYVEIVFEAEINCNLDERPISSHQILRYNAILTQQLKIRDQLPKLRKIDPPTHRPPSPTTVDFNIDDDPLHYKHPSPKDNFPPSLETFETSAPSPMMELPQWDQLFDDYFEEK